MSTLHGSLNTCITITNTRRAVWCGLMCVDVVGVVDVRLICLCSPSVSFTKCVFHQGWQYYLCKRQERKNFLPISSNS